MEQELILKSISEAKNSSKRNFLQSYELIINLKDIDIKKPEHQPNLFIQLPHQRGKKAKVCAFCGPELLPQAKEICDRVVLSDEFDKFKSKKEIKKLAEEHDYFIAQANVMTRVASVFGRVLGPRGKMPNPKAGCVVAPNANLRQLYDKLQNTINVTVKQSPHIQCAVGTESMKPEDIAENIMAVYDAVLHSLPNERENIKSAYIKLTMGKPVEVKDKQEAVKSKKK